MPGLWGFRQDLFFNSVIVRNRNSLPISPVCHPCHFESWLARENPIDGIKSLQIYLTHIYINLYRKKKDRDSHKSYTIRKRRSSLVIKPLLSQRKSTGTRSFWAPKRVKSDFFEIFSDMPCDTSYMVQMLHWLQKWSQISKILKLENFMARKLENLELLSSKVVWYRFSYQHFMANPNLESDF